MNDSVKNFVETLFNSQTTEPTAHAAEQWIEKLASINDPKTEDKKMGKLRDELNGMELEELTEIANQLVDSEKVAEDEGLSDEEIELLKNVSYADYLRAQESLEKEAEEGEEEEEIDPEEISAYDALMMQEKTAEESDDEDVPDHIRVGYEQGAAMAFGLSDGLYSVNGEKTAETREDLIDFIEEALEKDAGGGAVTKLKALLRRGKTYATKQYRGLRTAARAPYGKQRKTMGKLKNIAAKGVYYGGIPAGAAAAGAGAGYAAKKRREGK